MRLWTTTEASPSQHAWISPTIPLGTPRVVTKVSDILPPTSFTQLKLLPITNSKIGTYRDRTLSYSVYHALTILPLNLPNCKFGLRVFSPHAPAILNYPAFQTPPFLESGSFMSAGSDGPSIQWTHNSSRAEFPRFPFHISL